MKDANLELLMAFSIAVGSFAALGFCLFAQAMLGNDNAEKRQIQALLATASFALAILLIQIASRFPL